MRCSRVMTLVLWGLVATVSVGQSVENQFRFRDFGHYGSDPDDDGFLGYYGRAADEAEGYADSDFHLALLGPISTRPEFTKDPLYISPDEVIVARAKRKTKKQEKKQRQMAADADDDEASEEDDGTGKDSTDGGVDDYAERYAKFINEHFQDVENERQKDAAEDTDGSYGYRFDYEPSDDYERIKLESEEQSKQLAKEPGNCKTYEQNGMVCSVCKDPDSDTSSESCAYATEPHHRKYAYVKERNFDSKKKPEEDDEERAEDADDEDDGDDDERSSREVNGRQQDKQRQAKQVQASKKPEKKTGKPALRVKPHHLATNGGGYRYQPVDLRSNKEQPQKQTLAHPTYDKFYTHFFPSDRSASMKLLESPTTKSSPSDDSIFVMDYSDQADVAKVLDDFQRRDWSNCRKGNKDGLTCYRCTDGQGVKHEECVYLAESRQVAVQALPDALNVTARPKRKKVVPLKKPLAAKLKKGKSGTSTTVRPQQEEKQTVKRMVSVRSHVDSRGSAPATGQRVIHYEHRIAHRIPVL